MTNDDSSIDQMLAAVLRGEDVPWPGAGTSPDRVIDRILYHGLAGLVADRTSALTDWPAAVVDPIRQQGIALAMWEMRHKAVLGDLLAALAKAGIASVLLKGSAVAYDLYVTPATRSRGDSDLLIAPADRGAARSVFSTLGYDRLPLDEGIADDLALQEIWSLQCAAGTVHHVDLHWQLINAPALSAILDTASCFANPMPLPRLSPEARAMPRPLTLLHSCIHRAMHLTSPYFVDGVTYYGGDRLIWALDIHLLGCALSDSEWREFVNAAISQGVAAVCLDGLELARRTLHTSVPPDVTTWLGKARNEQASAYLLGSGQARRAWADLAAIPGLRRKLAYVASRGMPSASFMRGKYPGLSAWPLAMLHLRRMIELIRPRPGLGIRE